jgi:hypothetical protein
MLPCKTSMRNLLTVVCFSSLLCAQDAPTNQVRGLPPRAVPADYQAQGKAGDVTIGAEFSGHFVPTAQGTLTTDSYVIVETALFGTADAHAKLSPEDFSLRINAKKVALSSQPYALVFKSLKDPEWIPPDAPASSPKSKGGITSSGGGGGGGGQADSGPPPPVHVPFEVQRAMQLRVQKAAMPEGDRPLPVAGLLFFQFSGKTEGLRSIELIYDGPAGKATLSLNP